MSLTLPVESIADMAFLTAYCRALESDRPDALFNDPYARRLAGKRGEELLKRLKGWPATAAGCSVRTSLLDDMILQVVRESAIELVLNLGAGLDTRPYRLVLPRSLRWIEVDDPDMVAYKASKLETNRPTCIVEGVALDLTDAAARQALFARLGGEAEHVLVITEGLLIYLTQDQVSSLARDLFARKQFQWWLTDIASANAMRIMQQTVPEAPRTGNVQMRFAPEDGPGFFQQYGWEVAECRWCMEEGQRLKRMPMPEAFLAKLTREQWSVLRTVAGLAKLKRSEGQRQT